MVLPGKRAADANDNRKKKANKTAISRLPIDGVWGRKSNFRHNFSFARVKTTTHMSD
jgi:hypothetical protein